MRPAPEIQELMLKETLIGMELKPGRFDAMMQASKRELRARGDRRRRVRRP